MFFATGFPPASCFKVQQLCLQLLDYLFVFELNLGTVKWRPHPLSWCKLTTLFKKKQQKKPLIIVYLQKRVRLRALWVPRNSFLLRRSLGQRSPPVLIVPEGLECSEACSPGLTPDIGTMEAHCLCVSEWQPGWPTATQQWGVVGSSRAESVLVLLRWAGLILFANIYRAPKTLKRVVSRGTQTENWSLDVKDIQGLQCKDDVNQIFTGHVIYQSLSQS